MKDIPELFNRISSIEMGFSPFIKDNAISPGFSQNLEDRRVC
ncbi:hypothetical protein ADICYQ_1385 [Cyclobacterium qasimii M12-11B]|uniref:Uncharacterized protein n=1 Tax=Cyclobacterium qasimii M12-11B TaxID=641524 RepID=S7VHA5_9BACT|nr:hypothetical protein ADICYQ_1385 [Cyclobacterium qasimii M12-11B]